MTLTLILKKEWFDKIKSGEKRIEYRKAKNYWIKRLTKKEIKKIIFKNGYGKNAPSLIADFVYLHLVDGEKTDLKIPEYVFAIGFKNVKELIK